MLEAVAKKTDSLSEAKMQKKEEKFSNSNTYKHKVPCINGKPLVVALDGVAASGKGTVGRRVANYYNMLYLDTGAIYRSLAYLTLEAGRDPADEVSVLVAAGKIAAGKTVDRDALYGEGIGAAASVASAFASVREKLLEFQREFSRSERGAVIDGRDIGTVVCTDAPVKFFLTAELEARALRRFKQLQESGTPVIYDNILEDLRSRDARDSERKIAPLIKAQDAVALDTTQLDPDAVFHALLAVIEERLDS